MLVVTFYFFALFFGLLKGSNNRFVVIWVQLGRPLFRLFCLSVKHARYIALQCVWSMLSIGKRPFVEIIELVSAIE